MAWSGSSLKLVEWLNQRTLELVYTSWDIEAYARHSGFAGSPFRWDDERRFQIRAELDAAFFHLYLGTAQEWSSSGTHELLAAFPTPRHAVEHIMGTFPIVQRQEEEKYGHYRSKETILRIYDQLTEAIRTGRPYQSPLDPPPGDPRCCHPNDPDAAAHFAPRTDAKPQAASVPSVSKTPSAEVRRGPGRPPKSATNDGQATEAILAYLKSNAGMHGKSAILDGTGIDAAEWNAAIKQLVEEGKVKKEGEKKGARYGVAGKTNEPAAQPSATRYSDEELSDFRLIVLQKLDQARTEYEALVKEQQHVTEHPEMVGEDAGRELEERLRRQEKFIKHLEDALLRIRNKTYGICRVTGELISKERLRLVPHATLSIEAKQRMRG
jgi:RNA polymerase-binding transcription factor DksA